MTKGFIASMALALLCAGSMQASAAVSHKYSHRVVRYSHVTHQNVAALRAEVPARPTVFPSAWPRPYPYNFHETDGLSRNPNDCAVWGCIDNSN
jgi:hypothetical protein